MQTRETFISGDRQRTLVEQVSERPATGMPTRTGAFWVVVAMGVPRLIGAAITVALRRHLGPAASGIFDLAYSPYRLLDTFRSFGTGPALVFANDVTPALADTAWTLNMIAAVIVALLLQIIAAPVAQYFGHAAIEQVVRLLSIAYIFASLASVHFFLLLRDLNFRGRAVPPVGQVLVAGVVAILFAVWGFGVGALVAREITSAAAGAVLLWVIHPFRPRVRLVAGLARSILGYGVWVGAGLALLYLSQNADLFIGGRLIHRASDIGFYTTSWTLSFMIAGILTVLAGNVIFPTLSRVREDGDLLRTKLLTGLQQVAIVMMPSGTLLACLAPVVIVPVLGGRFATYQGSFVVLSLLSLYAVIRTLLAVFFEGYKAVGKPWLVPAYNACKLAVLVPSMIAGAHYGVIGLALGYVPVTVAEIPAALGVVYSVLSITPGQVWHIVRIPLLATAMMGGVTILAESVMVSLTHGSDLAALILAFLAGAISYLGSIVVLDRRLVREARIVLFAGL
jgi:PST family polysaccharide transporter